MMESDVFEKRLSEEYSKWLGFVTGKSEKIEIPFFPVSSFNRAVFTDFVAELVTKAFGPDFIMLSLVTEKGKPMFMLVERVEKGKFTSINILKTDKSAEEAVKGQAITVTKSVERSVLEEVFALQDKYRKTRDKRTYVLELCVVLANALKQGKLCFSPEPPALKGMVKAISRVNVDMNLLMGLKDYLISIEIISGKRSLLLDLGTPMRITIQKEHLFSLMPRLESVASLSSLFDSFLVWLADGFKGNAIRVEPVSFIWKGVESVVEHDAKRVGNKMKFMLSLFANPLFLLVVIGGDAYILEFRDGVIAGIERTEPKGDLKSTWLELSMKRTFIHLAFKVDPKVIKDAVSPIHLPSVLKRGVYEHYPKNEFVGHLNEMGALNLFLKLVYPFVKD